MKKSNKIFALIMTGVTAVSVAAFAACKPGGEEKHLHTLTVKEAKEATCAEEGNDKYWYCSGCGKYFSDAAAENETTLAAVTHARTAHRDLTKTFADDATCTADGNSDYWYCLFCKKYFSDESGATETTLEAVTIKASHTLTHYDGAAATCATAGNIEYWSCSACGKYFTDENAENETTEEALSTVAQHTLTHHDAVPSWKQAGNIEYWSCEICEQYFSDADKENRINQEDTVIAAVAVPDASADEDVFIGNAKANQDFWTAANWAVFGSSNYGSYANGSEKPELIAEDGETARHLLFTKAARFELFHVQGADSAFTHLGENSQGGNNQWGNTDNFSGLYDNTFIYTFDVTANGAFAFEVFGLASSKADRSGQGTSLLFDKNTIEFYAPISGGNNQMLKSIAALPADFDFGDGEHHTITLSIKRGAPVGGSSITDYGIYVDGYLVRFVNVEGISDDAAINANKDGTLKITIGNSGFGQRLSVIPQINSEEGAETTTYTQVRIFNLTIKRHYPETTEQSVLSESVAASLNEFIPDEQRI